MAGFTSVHFDLIELADGVLAAIARRDEGREFVNAGLVDLGECALAFDSFLLPQAARDLVRAAREVLGKPVQYLVNSHKHTDHVQGNYVFPAETVILSTHRTREQLEAHPESVSRAGKHVPAAIGEMESQLEAETDDAARRKIETRLAMFRTLAEVANEITLRLPNVTFDDRLVFHGARRQVELLTYGGGHTDSDAFLYLPDDRIIFTGDLLVVETHPYMMDGHPAAWRGILARIKQLDIAHAVPGHGPLGTPDDLDTLLGYFDDLDNLVAELVTAGTPPTAQTPVDVPARYAAWFGGAFQANLRFLVRQG